MDPYLLKRHVGSFCREIMWTKFNKTVNRAFFFNFDKYTAKKYVFFSIHDHLINMSYF